MLVCVKCKKVMTCERNGVCLRWDGAHVYRGDRWHCPKCGANIVNTATEPYHDAGQLKCAENYEMEGDI